MKLLAFFLLAHAHALTQLGVGADGTLRQATAAKDEDVINILISGTCNVFNLLTDAECDTQAELGGKVVWNGLEHVLEHGMGGKAIREARTAMPKGCYIRPYEASYNNSTRPYSDRKTLVYHYNNSTHSVSACSEARQCVCHAHATLPDDSFSALKTCDQLQSWFQKQSCRADFEDCEPRNKADCRKSTGCHWENQKDGGVCMPPGPKQYCLYAMWLKSGEKNSQEKCESMAGCEWGVNTHTDVSACVPCVLCVV